MTENFHPQSQEMGLEKEVSTGKSRGVAHMSEAWRPPCVYQDAPKVPAAVMHLSEELRRAHSDKEGTHGCCSGLASAVGSSAGP